MRSAVNDLHIPDLSAEGCLEKDCEHEPLVPGGHRSFHECVVGVDNFVAKQYSVVVANLVVRADKFYEFVRSTVLDSFSIHFVEYGPAGTLYGFVAGDGGDLVSDIEAVR